jgi:hypothetical protein
MADESYPPTKKAIIIVGDDGTLYQFSEDDLQSHKLAPGDPAFESAQKQVAEKQQQGAGGTEQFRAESATVNTDIWFAMSNQAVKPSEQ